MCITREQNDLHSSNSITHRKLRLSPQNPKSGMNAEIERLCASKGRKTFQQDSYSTMDVLLVLPDSN